MFHVIVKIIRVELKRRFPALQSRPQWGRDDLYVLLEAHRLIRLGPPKRVVRCQGGRLAIVAVVVVGVVVDGEQDVVGRRGC